MFVVLAVPCTDSVARDHSFRASCTMCCASCPEPTASNDWMRTQLDEFAAVYSRKPGGRQNAMGVNFLHGFGLWVLVRSLKAKGELQHIIESGCYRGVGSWLLRQAAGSGVQMSFVSPETPDLYVDRAEDSKYYTGRDFVDFALIAWPPTINRSATLVFIDDHQAAPRRVQEAAHHGFRHVAFDDNWLPNRGDCTSLKSVCSGRSGLTLSTGNASATPLWQDNIGLRRHFMQNSEVARLERLFDEAVEGYFELPPVWHATDGRNHYSKWPRHSLEAASHVTEQAWAELTAPALLSRHDAEAFCAKNGLSLNWEAHRYTHLAHARVREPKVNFVFRDRSPQALRKWGRLPVKFRIREHD